jgi:hypothetical protein
VIAAQFEAIIRFCDGAAPLSDALSGDRAVSDSIPLRPDDRKALLSGSSALAVRLWCHISIGVSIAWAGSPTRT